MVWRLDIKLIEEQLDTWSAKIFLKWETIWYLLWLQKDIYSSMTFDQMFKLPKNLSEKKMVSLLQWQKDIWVNSTLAQKEESSLALTSEWTLLSPDSHTRKSAKLTLSLMLSCSKKEMSIITSWTTPQYSSLWLMEPFHLSI